MAPPRKPQLAAVSAGPAPDSLAVCKGGVKSIKAAAQFTGTSRSFIWELIKARTVESFKIGKRRVIPRSALVRWLAEQRDAHLAKH